MDVHMQTPSVGHAVYRLLERTANPKPFCTCRNWASCHTHWAIGTPTRKVKPGLLGAESAPSVKNKNYRGVAEALPLWSFRWMTT